MAYRTIMVHMSDMPRADALLDAALALAQRQKAHLVGIAALPPPMIATFGLPDVAAPALLEDYRRAYISECERMRALFIARCGREGVAAEWLIEDAWATSVGQRVLEAAGAVDLIVASQADPQSIGTEQIDIADRMIVESGRPVIVVPRCGLLDRSIGRRIMIGWNGSREAVRAVFDALPLLRSAQKVSVVTISEVAAVAADPMLDRLCAALQRHGVATEIVRRAGRPRDVGDELLRCATEQSADLLVMGCYGHSRLREFVLGGVTRHVLEHMSLPVLMAH